MIRLQRAIRFFKAYVTFAKLNFLRIHDEITLYESLSRKNENFLIFIMESPWEKLKKNIKYYNIS